MTTLDLDAYFARIRWGDPSPPTLPTLAGILAAHMARIPFENLDVLLGRPIRLDLDALQDKLVTRHRGGYCFEHASLLAAVLDQLGFAVTRHTARVLLHMTRAESPRTHMFLVVATPDGPFVADPGFGMLAPRVPVPFAADVEVRSGLETHWLARVGGEWLLRARRGTKETDCWVSPADRDNLVDFELGNHYTSTHPDAAMTRRMMLRALTADGRVGVMNRDVTVWCGDDVEAFQLADRAALRALLAARFGFDLPDVERLLVPTIPEWR